MKMFKLLKTLLLAITALLLSFAPAAYAQSSGVAKLSLSPATASKAVGSSFQVEIKLNTGNEKVNSVYTQISFPKDLVTVEVSTLNSFANFFTQREVDTNTGTIKINGGVSDGMSGTDLLFATLTVTPKKAGSASFTFSNQSLVYKGTTNILGSSTGGTYTITSSAAGSTATASSSTTATSSSTTATSSSTGGLPEAGVFDYTLTLLLIAFSAATLGFGLKKSLG